MHVDATMVDTMNTAELAIDCAKRIRRTLITVFSAAEKLDTIERMQLFKQLESYTGLQLQEDYAERSKAKWFTAAEAQDEETSSITGGPLPTVREKVVAVLSAHYPEAMHINEISSLSSSNEQTVRKQLMHLRASSTVVMLDRRGFYKLSAAPTPKVVMTDEHIGEAILAFFSSNANSPLSESGIYANLESIPRERVIGVLAFLVSGGQLLFDPKSRLYRYTSTIPTGTTNASVKSGRVSAS